MAFRSHIIFITAFILIAAFDASSAKANDKNPSPNEILKAFQQGKTVTITTRGNIVATPYGYYAAPRGSVVYANPYPYPPTPFYYPQPYNPLAPYGLGYATGVIVGRYTQNPE